MTTFSLCSITARAEPHYDWLLRDLAGQALDGDHVELIIVDFFARDAAALGIDNGMLERAHVRRCLVVPPKPNIWQGPHRIASRDLHAIANARNTAIVMAECDYLVFLDDRVNLGPRWLAAVRAGERARDAAIAGPYDKRVKVGDEIHLSIDHRRERKPDGMINCGGGWLYGGNFALPLSWILDVNGCEEMCDPVGCEDYIMGQMVENRGHRIDFIASMAVEQDRTGDAHPFPRIDKGISPNDKSHAINKFGRRERAYGTPDLAALREHIRAGGSFPIPDPNAEHRDWYDGQLVREM